MTKSDTPANAGLLPCCVICKRDIQPNDDWDRWPDESRLAPLYLPKEAAGVGYIHSKCRKESA